MFRSTFKPALVMLLTVMASLSSAAIDLSGNDLILPIVARTPGAFGSQWRTDVVVTNSSRRMADVPVTIVSRPANQEMVHFETTLQPRGSIALHDILLGTFGFDRASGLIRITSSVPNARLAARARIYNVGSGQGEFGQTSQAIPANLLGREVYLSGLSGVGSNRTNVGIANPSAAEAGIFLSLFEMNGEFRGGYSMTVPASSVVQINDIFSQFPAGPLEDATIVITSSAGIYGYGSVVRSDSGDADFVPGVSASLEDSGVITPDCSDPAPLQLARPGYEAEGWIVVFHEGTNAPRTVAELSSRLGFTPIRIYEDAFPGFIAELTHETIAILRCESTVLYVQQNEYIPYP